MKKTILFIAFVLFSIVGISQATERTFYLKNGSVITGVVIEEIPGKQYKVKTADGNIFVWKADEIEKIVSAPIEVKTKEKEEFDVNKLAFYSLNELSLGAMIEETTTYNVGLGSINGVCFNNQFSLGIGVDFQLSGFGNFVPIYSDIRLNFSQSPKTFFTYINAGIAISGRSENITVVEPSWGGSSIYQKAIKYENGFYGRIGFGYKSSISDKFDANVSVFYTAHSYSASGWLYSNVYFNVEGIYSLVGVKLGVSLNKKIK